MLQFYFLGANIRKFFELCTVLVHEFFNYSLFLKIKGPVLLIISDHKKPFYVIVEIPYQLNCRSVVGYRLFFPKRSE